ncbi:nucleoside 2-deoxyribosyltransferase [Phyllobacterium myrsinacearum]|uniref:Nucleoside 2-deoxyribosyltransferase n=1 Tax=Phyllobacterium myrsinacearum TaxID=28101 RepID=A0A839EMQ5_9HYPH|nr:nucleoside 2-deoxyribosyltransferase [Phyllobacterium myrsinacearum]MBA8880122.1 nucleoside 2-deoxyribosyltransferase [Phyllobacterium myrsinacearum]
MTMKVYLAGPEVFLSNAKEVLAHKSELARAAGFTPLAPGDLEIPRTDSKYERGIAISAIDEQLMLASDLIIANLTPFRGISADVGTSFELGFMCALGRQVYGYTNVAASYLERTSRDYYKGMINSDASGKLTGSDGLSIEDFDMADNLMLEGGIISRGGVFVRKAVPDGRVLTDLAGFKECLILAAEKYLR